MRIKCQQIRQQEGSVLAITLVFCGILGILMGSYLYMLQTQHLSVARGQSWNSAIVVAEAGIEEAMAHLNSGISTNELAANSWTSAGSGLYRKTNTIGTSYSVVTIAVPPAVAAGSAPVVTAVAYVPGPMGKTNLTRTVQVQTKSKSLVGMMQGMVVKTTINLKGSKTAIDSFDSTATNYSSGGLYDPRKTRDQAQVATISSATNAIIVDGTIKGYVHTGPGGQVDASAGVVGDAAYVATKKGFGVQAGHFNDDATFNFTDVSLPQNKTWLPPIPGKYKINGVTYKYYLDGTAAWKVGTLDGNVYVSSPNVLLQVTTDFNVDSIKVASGASIAMYTSCPSVTLGGSGVVNDTGQAKNFRLYGLPTTTAINMSANATMVAQLYAPQADFTLGGGGNNTYDFIGASATKSVKMNGHFNFHYDESLAFTPAPSGYVVISWDEL